MTTAVLLAVLALSGPPAPRAVAPTQLAPAPAAAPAPVRQDTLASVAGVVRLGQDGGVVEGAAVEIRQGTELRRVRSGEGGRYLIDGLTPGPAELLVVHLAGHPLAVSLTLPEGRRLTVDLTLTRRVIELAAIRVRAVPEPRGPIPSSRASEIPGPAIRLEALESSSGIVESGLASAVRGDEPAGSDRVLYLRGSTIDARLVLLDGAPILSPFHVAGLVDPFPSELVGRADRYLGGAPASYSDGVSYVLDIETRPPPSDGDRVAVRADGLIVGATVQSRMPARGSIVASGRWLHGAQKSLGASDAFPYGYHEGLVRAGFAAAPGHDLRVTGFLNEESVRLDLPGAGPSTEAAWGNRAIAFGYDGVLGDARLEVSAAASRYESTLPVALEDPLLARGVGDRERAGVAAWVPAKGGRFHLGASVERLDFRYDVVRDGLAGNDVALGGAEGERISAGTTSIGGFGEWEGLVVPRLHVRAGLRADRFAEGSGLRVSPRVSATLALSDEAELSSAVGLYHQVLPAPGLHTVENPSAGPDQPAALLSWDPSLPVATAVHWLVGLRQDLGAGVSVGLTGFVKRFSALGPGLGRSNASGTEIQVAREGDRLLGWFGYGLSWFWAEEGPGGSSRFDARHLISAGFEGDIGAGLELRGSLGYGSGLPMTAVGLPSGTSEVFVTNAAPDGATGGEVQTTIDQAGGGAVLEIAPEGDFLRLDLEVARDIETSLAGRDAVIRPYLRVVNALSRRDALFYYYDRWIEDGARPVATQPVLPLVGIEMRF